MEAGRWPFKRGAPGYGLDSGDGERLVAKQLNFTKSFETAPSVLSVLSSVDVLKDFDHRVKTTVEGIR